MRNNLFRKSYWFLLMLSVFSFACTKDSPPSDLSASNDLTSFVFLSEKHPNLWADIETEIIDDTIFAYTLVGTDISALTPEFEHNGVKVTVAGEEQTSGSSPQDFSQLVEYSIEAENGDKNVFVVKFSDTGIPTVHLSTDGKPIDSKEEYVDGELKITKGLQAEVLYTGITEVKGRGNSTWGMPKKPYRIKLDEKAPLLEMPTDKSWTLLANYGDQSLLRNDVAFEVSRRLELEYTPRQRFVELFLNGEYMGNYTLTEHVKESEDRIPIDEDNGGFVIEEDGYANQEPKHFYTPRGMPITIKFPDDDEITDAEFNYIRDYVATFENSLFTTDGDPNAYQQYFDLPSFVKYYLINEICGNSDMLWSMRMYKKSNQDPKIYVGPVWDFDLAFNNDKRLGDSQKKLMLTEAHEPRVWMNRLMNDPEFKKLVRSQWNSIKANIESLPQYVDQRAETLKHSQLANFQRWDVLGKNINQSWYMGQSHQDYVDFIRDYLTVRISWLDDTINGEQFD
ncbi:CotH kinase family protein [Albibacterium profundi]|uniref:CotH kinase family protein n=1 Tax=Albibacterium profundi TaxID=3134906 RepID=A0ABV5CB67_9SPHI